MYKGHDMIACRPVVPGGAGGAMADQLTLSQPGGWGQIMPTISYGADFQTFLWPCIKLLCTIEKVIENK